MSSLINNQIAKHSKNSYQNGAMAYKNNQNGSNSRYSVKSS